MTGTLSRCEAALTTASAPSMARAQALGALARRAHLDVARAAAGELGRAGRVAVDEDAPARRRRSSPRRQS